MPQDCEVLVVGAGIAGSMSAALLARSGIDVILLHSPHKLRSRPELLSPEATLHLQGLGFPIDRLEDVAVRCLGIVDRWRDQVPVYTDLELTRCAPAWAVEREVLDESLRNFAAGHGARVIYSDAFVRLKGSPLEPRLTLASTRGETARASFLLDATGMTSSLMEAVLRRRVWSDRLAAVNITLSRPPEPADWMHLSSSSEGWWYTLSTTASTSQAVFLTDADLLPKKRQHLWIHLGTQFEEAFPGLSCLLNVPVTPTIRAASTSCRKCLWQGGWLPIGDAAFTLDPLSGNGIGRALQMAEDVSRFDWQDILSGHLDAPRQAALAHAKTFNQLLRQLRGYYFSPRGDSPNSPGRFWRRRSGEPNP